MGTVADYLLLTNTYYQLAIRTNSAVAITGITGSGYEVNDFIPTYITNDGSLTLIRIQRHTLFMQQFPNPEP